MASPNFVGPKNCMYIYSFIFAKRETNVGLQPTKLRLRVLISEFPSKCITDFNRTFRHFHKKMPKLCVSVHRCYVILELVHQHKQHEAPIFSHFTVYSLKLFAVHLFAFTIGTTFMPFPNSHIKKIYTKNRWMETPLALAGPSACPAAPRPPPSALGVVCLSLLELVGH